jgi:flagellar hook assembly protein FlgD
MTISFLLGKSSNVTIRIYDESGRLVRLLVSDRMMDGGEVAIQWDGKNEDGKIVSSGLYIVVITADGEQEQKPIAVVN